MKTEKKVYMVEATYFQIFIRWSKRRVYYCKLHRPLGDPVEIALFLLLHNLKYEGEESYNLLFHRNIMKGYICLSTATLAHVYLDSYDRSGVKQLIY